MCGLREVRCGPSAGSGVPGGRRGGGGGRPSSAAATLGQKLSAITAAAVPSGVPSRGPLSPDSTRSWGSQGQTCGGRTCCAGHSGPDAPGSEGAPWLFRGWGREELSAWRGVPGGTESGEAPGEAGCPWSRSAGAPPPGEVSLPLPSLLECCQSGVAATASGPRGGKSGRALRILWGNFPTPGHSKVNFSPAIELVLFPPPWGNRLKKKKASQQSFSLAFQRHCLGEVWL